MLASTLIKRLQEQIEVHGDLPVHVGHPTERYPIKAKVSGVDRIHKGDKTTHGDWFIGYSSWPDCIRLRATTD